MDTIDRPGFDPLEMHGAELSTLRRTKYENIMSGLLEKTSRTRKNKRRPRERPFMSNERYSRHRIARDATCQSNAVHVRKISISFRVRNTDPVRLITAIARHTALNP